MKIVGLTLPMIAAIVAYGSLVAGFICRKKRQLHVRLMSFGIALDFILVLLLELQRHVINSALTEPYSLFQRAHVLASSVAVLLYFPTVYFGLLRFFQKAGPSARQWHIRFALSALLFRTLGFFLMFSFLSR